MHIPNLTVIAYILHQSVVFLMLPKYFAKIKSILMQSIMMEILLYILHHKMDTNKLLNISYHSIAIFSKIKITTPQLMSVVISQLKKFSFNMASNKKETMILLIKITTKELI